MLVPTAQRIRVLAIPVWLIAALSLPSAANAVDLYSQNFESVTLGPIVTYGAMLREREAWTATPPAGMSVDNSGMPPAVMSDPNEGVTEFEGWTFVDKAWWVATAGDQQRSGFSNGLGKIAVADNDTHDDWGNPDALGPFDSKLLTPSISLMGAAPNTVNITFFSSWRPEEIQKATLTARYNNGVNVEVLRWHSDINDPFFHNDAVNEIVTRPLQNPAGASSVILEFRLFDATNNWWWAIDNISVYTGSSPASDGVLRAIIDRNTSNVRIVNNTGATVNLRGYSLRSSAGAFNEANAAFLADSDPNWIQLTAPNATGDLSEGHLSSYSLANSGSINLGNNVWRKYFVDSGDITFEYLIAGNDNPIPGIVEFTGNGGQSFPFLDLNFSGVVEIGDWDTFRAGFPVSLAGKSTVERYQLGDLDNDGQHTALDFLRFRNEYDAIYGAGAFDAMLASASVPEPATSVMFLVAAVVGSSVWMRQRRRRNGGFLPAIGLLVLLMVFSATPAQAQLTLFSENFEGLTLGPNVEEALAGDRVWTETPPPGWTKDDSGVPGALNPPPDPNNGVWEWAGWSFADKNWWATTAGDQQRSLFTRGQGVVMIADPDEWDDQPHPSGLYNAFITTPVIPIPPGIPAGRIKLAFDSSWRPEGNDDNPNLLNDQRATIKASYNGGAPLSILTWTSLNAAPGVCPSCFHPDAPNEAVQVDLQYNGTATNVQLTFGLDLAENDWWWAVDNIRVFVPANPLKLRVNLTTGQVSITGDDVIPTPINYIDITSANGVLNGAALAGLSTSRPDSVDGPDPGSTVGDSSGEYWQNLSATNNRVTEAFLLGSSSFTSARTEFLGNIFNTSTLPANRDIVFTYTNIFNDVVTGIVEYFTPPSISGDYNGDGKVDAADYVRWRKNPAAHGGNPGGYNTWRANFGAMAGSGSGQVAAVPEPSGGLLAMLALVTVGLVATSRRRLRGGIDWFDRLRTAAVRVGAAVVAAATVNVVSSETASAAVPPPPVLDRNYDMGEGEGGVPGNTVSVTWDTAGAPGLQQLIDLVAVNGPRYEALPTAPGGPVPMRPDGGTGVAIRLNPTATSQGQHLKTGFEQALNYPPLSYSSTGQPGGTIDYTYIRDRGFQLWVLPQTSGRADIVMDTNQHGALINASGNFAMRYINTDYDTLVPVVPNTWYHLMVIRPFGPSRGSIMYVNGVAVAQASGTYRGEDSAANEETTPLVVGANTSSVAFQVGAINRFQGLVDDLEMFVMGMNSTRDYGDFVFERDNKYAAFFKPSVAADLTNDNIVNMADVNIFVSNWLYQKVVGNQVIGDLETRMRGDFNFDGRVNLRDWEILNELAPPGVGAAALAMLRGVPEPSCLALLLMAFAGLAGLRTRQYR